MLGLIFIVLGIHTSTQLSYCGRRMSGQKLRVGTLKIKFVSQKNWSVLVFFSIKKSAFSLKLHFLCSFHKCNCTTCLYLVLLQWTCCCFTLKEMNLNARTNSDKCCFKRSKWTSLSFSYWSHNFYMSVLMTIR